MAAEAAAAEDDETSSGEEEEEEEAPEVAVAPLAVEATSLAPADEEPAVVTAPWVAETGEEVLTAAELPAEEEVASAAEEVPLAVEDAALVEEAAEEDEALAFSLRFEPWALQELSTDFVASSTRSPHLDLRQDLMSPPALSQRQEMLARSLSQSAFLETSATQANTQLGVVAETRPAAPTAVKMAVENFIVRRVVTF